MADEYTRASGEKTIHRFTVSRYATAFDPLAAIADASRQAQAEQVVGALGSPDDEEALNFYYEVDHCGPDVYVDLLVWGTDPHQVHTAALTLHQRYEGHPDPQEIVEELEVSA